MQPELDARIRALQAMPTADLKREWIDVFGAPPRSGNVQWMRKRLIHQANVAVLGDLSPEAKARLEYLMQFAPLWVPMGRRSPAHGLVEHLNGQPPATSEPSAPSEPVGRSPSPGTVLTRVYKGRTVQVLVRENGFEYDGRIYPSLTAAVHAITGSHWNPSVFFSPARRRKSA